MKKRKSVEKYIIKEYIYDQLTAKHEYWDMNEWFEKLKQVEKDYKDHEDLRWTRSTTTIWEFPEPKQKQK